MSDTSPESSGAGSNPSVTLVIKACDMCRKKKIKCDPTGQTCVQCIKYKTLCHFTPISTKRAARKPAGHKRVEELEKRLKSMEESLKRATEKLQQPQPRKEPERTLVRRKSPDVAVLDETGFPSFMDQLHSDTPMDLGSNDPWAGPISQSFEMNWPNGTASNPVPMLSATPVSKPMPAWSLSPMSEIFTRRVYKPLPPKDEAIALIRISLHGFNSAFPLFDENFFIQKLDDLDNSIKDPAFWACLNTVLALAHRFQIAINLHHESEEKEAWGFFQNALGVVNELTLMPPSLMSCQALLGMAIIIQGTPNPAPYSFLMSASMKMAQALGLHRQSQDPSLTTAEIEQRKRVFWIAYFLDKDISLRTNNHPTQDDDDMDVEQPDFSNIPDFGSNRHNFFRLRINLALIQGKIYKRLLSVRANRQSVAERVAAVRDLSAELESWKSTVPSEYQQDYYRPAPNIADLTPVLHSVILRLTYFHALNAVHRFATPVNQWQEMMNRPADFYGVDAVHEPPAPITCIEEARKALKLLLITPQGDFACIWVVLHIFVSATNTLLTLIQSDPSHGLAQADLQLIEPLLSLLGLLSLRGKSAEVEVMYENCRTAWERARRMVWEARGRGLPSHVSGQGRSLASSLGVVGSVERGRESAMIGGKVVQERESLEDFMSRIESIAGGSESAFEFEFA